MTEVISHDQEHLRLLTIFHYVVGALAGLFSCFFLIHVVIGIVAIVSPESFASKSGSTPPPPFFGWLFAGMGTLAVLLGWSFATCLVLAGRFLKQRRHYLFCLIMAALSCFFTPFGTVLGIFTIIVLMRPSVKELFA